MKGKFIPLLIPFQTNKQLVPAAEQALQILKAVDQLTKENSCKYAGITYSSNYDQTKTIRLCYLNNKSITGINGANQAAVIHEIEKLLSENFLPLQGKFRVVPVTTMTYTNYDDLTLEAVIENDLKEMKNLLDEGYCIFGWMNQNTAPEYAIGGGIASLPDNLQKKIQETLKHYSEKYP
jgi:hypothetical protein